MALNIFEMSDAAMTGPKPVRAVPFQASQSMTPSGTSAMSAAFARDTKFITVQNTGAAIVFVKFGTAPVAITATGYAIAAGETHDFEVRGGDKLAVIT